MYRCHGDEEGAGLGESREGYTFIECKVYALMDYLWVVCGHASVLRVLENTTPSWHYVSGGKEGVCEGSPAEKHVEVTLSTS
jgi:hypothetical protein